MEEQPLILVVEDDEATAAFLADNLIADGFRVARAASVGEGLRAIEVRQPRLVPARSGARRAERPGAAGPRAVGRRLATRIDPQLPVMVLTGRAGEADRVRSLNRGADDHLCKPFLYAELLARMRAVLRRTEVRRGLGTRRVGELTVDPLTRTVRLADRTIELSAKEFALLQALAEQPTRVFLKQELLRDVWGFRSAGNTRTLDAHACRLRKKLTPSMRPFVINVRGVGYKLTEPV